LIHRNVSSPAIGDVQRQFYNAAYDQRTSANTVPSLLKRLELHRVDAVTSIIPSGGRLLDVGCGDGHLLAKCVAKFDYLVGIDVADAQIRAATDRLTQAGARNTHLVQANIDRGIPLRSEQFDVVCVVAVLGFVFDPVYVLAELRRVLKAGGHLAVEVLNLVYLPRRLALLAGQLPVQSACIGWEGGHLHNFTRGSFEELLRDSGFVVETVTGSGVLAQARSWWPSLLTGNLIVLATKV
jgi:ubiquinone/menaquinone biosynthesis C-methylase UbiE